MTHKDSDDYSAIIGDMRRLVRRPFETPPGLRKLRESANAERARLREKTMEILATQANVDWRPLAEEAQRSRERRKREVLATLAELEAEAVAHAGEEKKRFHGYRAEYLKAFADMHAHHEGFTQLKFRDAVSMSSDVREGDCTYFGSGFWNPWIGPSAQASAEIGTSTSPPGIWMYPRLFIDANSCDDVVPGMTWHDVTYRLGTPDPSFGVTAVRVDLIANGIATSAFGDTGWFHSPDHLYEHSFVQLDIVIAQQVNGEWMYWPIVSDRLFSGKGEYSREIRSLLSGQTYPANVVVRKSSSGGGDVLCFVNVTSSVQTIGTDGIVRIDYGATNAQGIFLGGVALLGTAV
jgi:hypothetical protein